MANQLKVHIPRVHVVGETEYRTVGQKNTPLCTFRVAVNEVKKEGDEWETVGTLYFDAEVWGDSALEAATLSKGDVIILTADVAKSDDGDYYPRHRAILQENSWTGKDGKKHSKQVLKIFDFEKSEK